jgi:hypothetical protein
MALLWDRIPLTDFERGGDLIEKGADEVRKEPILQV